RALNKLACDAAKKKAPSIPRNPKEDISKSLQKYVLNDEDLVRFQPQGENKSVEKSIYALGRFCSYLADFRGNQKKLIEKNAEENFPGLIYRALTGESEDRDKLAIMETMITACIDHGVTPPSAQATLIAASVRAAYEVGIAQGVGAITNVHGGAGAKAAEFFTECAVLAKDEKISLKDATHTMMKQYISSGIRIEGMGHRLHAQDPRRDILWSLAEKNNIAGDCVKISKIAQEVLKQVRGITLPVNVDGVIGAIVADMGLDFSCAKAIFIFGRICGLSAHYFEEIITQPPMRRINFSQVRYKGPKERKFPAS
ncbi:MAG: citrate/2-methylcitrate synthase, partial [bacterium]